MKFPRRYQSVHIIAFLFVVACCTAHFPAAGQTGSGNTRASESRSPQVPTSGTVVIPGPLRSFLRMAGISQEVSLEEVLPMLARNASLYGYQGGRETEYLVLVDRYLHQARELQSLADANGTIRVAKCEDAARLIEILGYKYQRACGQKDVAFVTANAERAFLTIDSGFPLTTLEQSLANNEPFTYSFPATLVPMIYEEKDWVDVSTWNKKGGENLVDQLLHDQNLDRLYAALSKSDKETQFALLQAPGLKRLAMVASVFDLYGREICIRSGKVLVPGDADKAWEEMVGASPNAAGDFVIRLLSKDNGWMAAYFDVLSRLNAAQQVHFADGSRMRRLYNAYRSTASPANAAHGVFPRNAELLMLFTSLKWEANGDLSIPGGIAVWQDILSKKNKSTSIREAAKRGHCCDNPERLLDTLVAASNLDRDSGPTQIFLMLSAINSGRPAGRSMSDPTELLVAERLPQFNRWFPIFAEFPALDDTSITHFVSAADRIDGIANPALRANALGAFQAEVGIWEIFARQGQIPTDKLNSSWQDAVQPYTGIASSVQLFEAARTALKSILQAAGGNGDLTQDQIVELLAGPVQENSDSQRVHRQLASRITAVVDDQRLVSLDSLFGLYDGLTEMAQGKPAGENLLLLAGNLHEFEMPRPIFTGNEKSSWSPIVYSSRHAELQVRTDLTKILRSPGSKAQLEAARGQLTPFLRDTLVGLNYAYYEPPGAEVLHNNPLFIRSHDFSSISVQGIEHIWGVPELIGVGATAGGGAYLMGSLADLPYALASTEEDFIAPKNVQALIWKEVVPDLLVGAVLPRWWSVSRNELHAAALYQRAGEELLIASATNAELKEKVISILTDRMTPDRVERTEQALMNPDGAKALVRQTLPAENFYLAVEFKKRYPDQVSQWGPAGRDLEDLSRKDPSGISPVRLSAVFGVPHPALVLTNTCALLNMKPLSAYGGNASRLLAESWESNNLYWARLADEMGYPPVMLNILVPTLTRRMIANIFASNIDDWPALLRALEETGDEFREGKIAIQAPSTIARQ